MGREMKEMGIAEEREWKVREEDQRKSREERGSGYIVGDRLSPANKPNSIWKIKMD